MLQTTPGTLLMQTPVWGTDALMYLTQDSSNTVEIEHFLIFAVVLHFT